MASVFIDAAFLIALLRTNDVHHDRAVALADDHFARPDHRFVTTQFVIAEVMAFVARGGPRLRAAAADQYLELASRSDCAVMDVSPELFDRAARLYRQRLDKRYSLADCVSMIVCRDLSITEILTSDSDFEHEGFTILLKV